MKVNESIIKGILLLRRLKASVTSRGMKCWMQRREFLSSKNKRKLVMNKVSVAFRTLYIYISTRIFPRETTLSIFEYRNSLCVVDVNRLWKSLSSVCTESNGWVGNYWSMPGLISSGFFPGRKKDARVKRRENGVSDFNISFHLALTSPSSPPGHSFIRPHCCNRREREEADGIQI